MKPQTPSHVRNSLLAALALVLLAALPARAGVGVWTPVGPGAGAIRSVTLQPSLPGTLWLGLPAGGLYRSSNEGATWSWAGRPMAGWGVAALTAELYPAGMLWAATDAGIFLTRDGGDSWAQWSGEAYVSALAGESPRAVATSVGDLYVLTQRRLLVSHDHGTSWSSGYEAGSDEAITAFGSGRSREEGLYIAVSGPRGFDLLKSPNGLPPWTSVRPWAGSNGIGQIVVTRTAVYAVLMGSGSGSGLLQSRDHGATWRLVLSGDSSFSLSAVATDPRWPHAVWATGWSAGRGTLWVSRNDGAAWQARPDLPLVAWFLAADPGGHAVYISDGKTLARSFDGGAAWETVLAAPGDDSPPAQLAFAPDEPSRMSLSVGYRTFLTGDGGRTWRWLPSTASLGLTGLDFVPSRPERMLGISTYQVMSTADEGRTWKAVAYFGTYLESLVRVDSRTLYTTGCGIFRSTDQGQTWRAALGCYSRYADSGRFVQKLEVDPAHTSRLYALSFQPKEFFPDHGVLAGAPSILWKSADSGSTWQKIGTDFRAFAFDRTRSRLYAARDKDLLASDDAGAHWRKVAETPTPVHELLVDRTDPLTLYATDGRGVLRSRDGGRTWVRFEQSQVSERYYPSYVYSLVQHPARPATLYARTDGNLLELTFPDGP